MSYKPRWHRAPQNTSHAQLVLRPSLGSAHLRWFGTLGCQADGDSDTGTIRVRQCEGSGASWGIWVAAAVSSTLRGLFHDSTRHVCVHVVRVRVCLSLLQRDSRSMNPQFCTMLSFLLLLLVDAGRRAVQGCDSAVVRSTTLVIRPCSANQRPESPVSQTTPIHRLWLRAVRCR